MVFCDSIQSIFADSSGDTGNDSGDLRISEFFTYTAVVDNLNDGGELASEGTAADQDEAANLDQLPRSELDIDIGHGEGCLEKHTNSAVVFLIVIIVRSHSRSTGLDESEGCCRRKSNSSKLALRISDVPTQFSLSGPLVAGLGLAYVSHPDRPGRTINPILAFS